MGGAEGHAGARTGESNSVLVKQKENAPLDSFRETD